MPLRGADLCKATEKDRVSNKGSGKQKENTDLPFLSFLHSNLTGESVSKCWVSEIKICFFYGWWPLPQVYGMLMKTEGHQNEQDIKKI